MTRSFNLAWRYILHHKVKSVLIVLCIVLTTLLPIALSILLSSFNRQIVARADSTPLIVGARGSRLDLTMHTLYFQSGEAPDSILYDQRNQIGKFGKAIPVHVRITARKVPVVGTTLDYFDFRQLKLANGPGLIRLGDCVLGAKVAKRMNLTTGDTLLTDRENLYELAGQYPLKMRVNGVLEPTLTADDDVVFVDLKTAWVVEGLGHGHQDIEKAEKDGFVLKRDGQALTASAAVLPYMEVTDNNANSFHFHGGFDQFPITALIVLPNDEKGEALIQGRFESNEATAQASVPSEVVQEMMQMVFRVQKFFNANAILIGLSSVLLLVLVILLSIRLRESEMQTMFKIGCGKGTMANLIFSELLILFLIAALCIGLLSWLVLGYSDDLVQNLLARSA